MSVITKRSKLNALAWPCFCVTVLPLYLPIYLPVCVDSGFIVLFFCQFYFTNILIITHLNVDKGIKLVYNVLTE